MKKRLPEKLSELILEGLECLEKAENDPRCRVNMHVWLEPDFDATYLCFGAAYAVFGLGRRLDHWLDWAEEVRRGTDGLLFALNEVRVGEVICGLHNFGLDWSDCDEIREELVEASDPEFPTYEADPEGWKDEMRWIARFLAERGL